MNVDLFKGLSHIGYGERDQTVVRAGTQLVLSCMLVWYARVTGQLAAVLSFVVHNSLHALPHPTSVRAGVVGFNLSSVLTLCLFDGLLEGIGGFLISVRVRVPLLESGKSAL